MAPRQNACTGPVSAMNSAAESSAPVRSSARSRSEVMGKLALYAGAVYVKRMAGQFERRVPAHVSHRTAISAADVLCCVAVISPMYLRSQNRMFGQQYIST